MSTNVNNMKSIELETKNTLSTGYLSKFLVKPNNLLEELCKKDKRFSPVTEKDIKLFQDYFKEDSYTYGNSWSYLIQGVNGIGERNLGYKYYDGENLSMITFFPKHDDEKVIAFYWIRPMGKTILKQIKTISEEIFKQGYPVYVKKIFKEQYDFLLNSGFSDTSNFPWHFSAPQEDDTYPERIIDIKHTLKIVKDMGRRKRLKRAAQYHRKFDRLEDVKIFNVLDRKEDSWKLVQKFFRFYRKFNTNNLSDPEDYYNLIFNANKDSRLMAEVIYKAMKPIGLYFIEIQNQDYASQYATMTLRNEHRNLSDFIMFRIFYKLNEANIKYLNLGGSEQKSLDDFKLKFEPQRTIKMYWACKH